MNRTAGATGRRFVAFALSFAICASSAQAAVAANNVHYGAMGYATTSPGVRRLADGVKADSYIYARQSYQDGEWVSSKYLVDHTSGEAVEYGWGWLWLHSGPHWLDPILSTNPNSQVLTLFLTRTYPTYDEYYEYGVPITPETRPRLHLRLNPSSNSHDDMEYFLDNVRIDTWANTHVYPPAFLAYGSERYNTADFNRASWTYCGYSNLVGGSHQWHYVSSAMEWFGPFYDPDYYFWVNKISQDNHCLYVRDVAQ